LDHLRGTLETYSTGNLSDFLKVKPSSFHTDGPKVAQLLPNLRALSSFIAVVGKKTYADDFNELLRHLSGYANAPLSSFKKVATDAVRAGRATPGKTTTVNQLLVEQYAQLLQNALGDDSAFMSIYDRLKNDKAMTQKETAALANKFNGPMAPSTPKKKAMARVLSRHRKLIEFTDDR
jgi:hypothetical protein